MKLNRPPARRRAWEAVFFVLLTLSVCFAAMAVCGAIAGAGA